MSIERETLNALTTEAVDTAVFQLTIRPAVSANRTKSCVMTSSVPDANSACPVPLLVLRLSLRVTN